MKNLKTLIQSDAATITIQILAAASFVALIALSGPAVDTLKELLFQTL